MHAAKAPGTGDQFRQWASHIVLATVQQVAIEVTGAHVAGVTWGNTDYRISVRLRVQEVEKGDTLNLGEEIVALAHQPRTRRAVVESFAPGGHRPIPARGEQVRVYLRAGDGHYNVYLPNGFTPAKSASVAPSSNTQGKMRTAPEVSDLGHWWTFGIPVELWVLTGFIALAVAAVVGGWAGVRKPPDGIGSWAWLSACGQSCCWSCWG